jgi:hypothetical protein
MFDGRSAAQETGPDSPEHTDQRASSAIGGLIGTCRVHCGGQKWTAPFYGALDEFRIYDRALTADEIFTLFP